MNKRKICKLEKGITLIALVVTIVIILILSIVVVKIALDNGLFTNAKEASERYGEEAIKERIIAIITSAFADDNYIFEKDNLTIEEALNKYKDSNSELTVPNFEWTGRENAIDIFYDGYICVVDRTTGRIIEIKKVNFESTATGKSLDGKSIEEINEEAKIVDYRVNGINEEDSHNLLYSSYGNKMSATIHNGSGEYVWYEPEDEIKMAAEIYCGDNIMIYDGNGAPYVPVMARFYRQNKKTIGVTIGSTDIGGTRLGLDYVAVGSQMTFSTVNENNEWAFAKGKKENEFEYDYALTSDRKCSSIENGGTTFKDRTSGHYYASGRLTYTGEPLNPITNLGSFSAKIYDSTTNTVFTLTTGSNYVIDGRRYYGVLEEAQELLNNTPQNTKVATEYHALAREILEAKEENYNLSDPGMVVYKMEEHITKLQAAIDDLNRALDELPHISDEVLAVVRHAQETTITIPTIEVTGGNKVFYTSDDTVLESGCSDQTWTNDKVEQNVQIYCANNVLIYDGTSAPYVPVMAKYYRKLNVLKATKKHGLSYMRSTNNNFEFTTCNENNDWYFLYNVIESNVKKYDYDATSDDLCASNTTSTSSFSGIAVGNKWASGRLTYNGTPTELLTNLGGFTVTSADENGNNIKNISQGSNYVINAKIYYDKIAEAKTYLTMDNLYNDLENTYELAQLINELRNEEYSQTTAQALANTLQNNINRLDEYINKLK